MMKRALFAAPASLALIAAAPLAAQDAVDETVEVTEDAEVSGEIDPMAMAMGMFGEMFKVEPLTTEQEARLPTAERIANKIMPEGTLAEVMQDMMGGFLDPIMDMAPSPAELLLTKSLGISRFETDLTDEQLEEVATVIDPSWKERAELEKAVLPEMMAEVANVMEPGLRKAMAEMYAIGFEGNELAELETFFDTTVGAKFARESYKMATDPRVLGASFEALPQLLGTIGSMEEAMKAATADLPEQRDYSALSAGEKARISDLTGLTDAQIEANVAAAEEAALKASEWMEEGEEGEAAEGDDEADYEAEEAAYD